MKTGFPTINYRSSNFHYTGPQFAFPALLIKELGPRKNVLVVLQHSEISETMRLSFSDQKAFK